MVFVPNNASRRAGHEPLLGQFIRHSEIAAYLLIPWRMVLLFPVCSSLNAIL